MTERRRAPGEGAKPPWALASLVMGGLLIGLIVVAPRPDRPVATIDPGSSSGPAFVVQIIRPRLGLPLGGLLPPELFGLEAHMGFASTSAGASIGRVSPARVELSADGWDVLVVLDADGWVTPATRAIFEFTFEERLRRVRCQPAEPAVGTLGITTLRDSRELSGHFDIELARCEDADTGVDIGWPPRPLILRGSFDRFSASGNGD